MSILEKIQSPSDVRKLSDSEIPVLGDEIRQRIIETVSKNGGHLASNLGIVELTLAMHLVFSVPEDTIVFDVGHQAYAHKLVTGRAGAFATLRQENGISGFTNWAESEYDTMTAGHSGSSLSYAIGIAEANRINGSEAYTIAVIGDGSFTNGMVYEALNNAAVRRLRLIIVLNDNEMSISRNVGSLSRYFSQIRTGKAYFSFKLGLKRLFSSIPVVGGSLIRGARRVRDFMKRLLITENLFENLGLSYYGPVAGDNLPRLKTVLKEAKLQAAEHGAVVVHVNTKKGLGYPPAEQSPSRYHSTGPFDLEHPPMENSSGGTLPTGNPKTFTEVFSRVITQAGTANPKVCAVTAAMTDGCGLTEFSRRFPHRFFDTGIAEEHAVTFAGGLSRRGMKPVVAVYSTFLQRTFDQIWHDCALQEANVTFAVSHCGVVPGDGVTHQGIYDVSLLAPVPGIKIWSPATFAEGERSFEEAMALGGLSVVRYPKGGQANLSGDFLPLPGPGVYRTFPGTGAEVLLVTYGRISENVCAAAEAYSAKTGRKVTLVILRQILPLPVETLRPLVDQAERIFFVEEGIRTGGIGEMTAAAFPGRSVTIRAITEGFLPHGTVDALLRRVGLDCDALLRWMTENDDN